MNVQSMESPSTTVGRINIESLIREAEELDDIGTSVDALLATVNKEYEVSEITYDLLDELLSIANGSNKVFDTFSATDVKPVIGKLQKMAIKAPSYFMKGVQDEFDYI